ncbi:MAG TPA: autotransporter outer membrane beta-barrel domain-containing protein [Chthoniobacterales bacterium]|nr:autotransporter outer membrane beta-barrel domain-containing protein [Chthoniobacterales bacterium]
MRTALRYVLAATFALLLAATTTEAQTRNILFGAVGGGTLSDLFILNPANGSVIADLGPTGFSITGLRFDPTTGILYGSTANVGPSRGSLITLNPITGTGTLVGSFGIANHTMADITFTKNGTLYGWAEPQRDDLHIINKATGAATDVGNAGISTFGSGLSANSKDVLYYTGSGGTGPLRIIDKATGLPTTVATLSGAPLGNGPINALAFNSADVLYGVQGTFGGATHLITINTVTGVITDLGTSLNGLDALAFLFSNDPEELSAIYQIGFSQATVQALNLQRRMDDIRAGSRGFCDNVTVMPSGKDMSGGKGPSDGKTALLPTPTSEPVPPAPENKWGMFVTGVGEVIDVNDDGFGRTGYDVTSGGFMLGVDYRFCDSFAAGLYGGYTRSDVDFNAQPFGLEGGGLTADSGSFGLYATWYKGGFYVDGGVSGGFNSYDIHRNDIFGFENGSTDGWQFDTFAAAGYDFHWHCLMFGPVASIQYTDVNINSFTEENSSILALHYPDQDEHSLRSNLGLRWSFDWKLGDHLILRTESRAVWKHEFEDTAYGITSRFALAALGPSNLTVFGPDIGRDSALVSGGFSLLWNERVSTYAHADSEYGRKNYENTAVSAGVRITF